MVIDELCSKLHKYEDGEIIASLILDYLTDEKRKNVLVALLSSFKKTQKQEQIKLTKVEKAAYEFIKDQGAVTVDDVIENLSLHYDSFKYRSHTSDILNRLFKKGLVGKITYGKEVYFFTPREAVIQAMKDLDMLPTKCNVKKIAEYTGLDIEKVLDIIEEMS